jgi:hypothetical protein
LSAKYSHSSKIAVQYGASQAAMYLGRGQAGRFGPPFGRMQGGAQKRYVSAQFAYRRNGCVVIDWEAIQEDREWVRFTHPRTTCSAHGVWPDTLRHLSPNTIQIGRLEP